MRSRLTFRTSCRGTGEIRSGSTWPTANAHRTRLSGPRLRARGQAERSIHGDLRRSRRGAFGQDEEGRSRCSRFAQDKVEVAALAARDISRIEHGSGIVVGGFGAWRCPALSLTHGRRRAEAIRRKREQVRELSRASDAAPQMSSLRRRQRWCPSNVKADLGDARAWEGFRDRRDIREAGARAQCGLLDS